MSNMRRIVTQGTHNTKTPASYVGKVHELTIDVDAAQIRCHDGKTAGGTLIGGGLKVGPPVVPSSTNGPPTVSFVPNAYNVIADVGQFNDGFLLPAATAGTVDVVFGVYGTRMVKITSAEGDTINGSASDCWYHAYAADGTTAIAPVMLFVCHENGNWLTNGLLYPRS